MLFLLSRADNNLGKCYYLFLCFYVGFQIGSEMEEAGSQQNETGLKTLKRIDI